MRLHLAVVVVVAACLGLSAPTFAASFVAPSALTATEGNDFFGYGPGPLTMQERFDVSTLGGLPVGAVITGMQVRLNGGRPTNFVSNTQNFDVSLGSATGATLNVNFASNKGADTVVVRSGPLTIPTGSLPGGKTPNDFGGVIPFSTPFTYTGGALLLSLTFTAVDVPLSLDASRTGAAGVRYQQADSYNATNATTQLNGGALPVAFQYNVPEPSVAAMLALGGVAVWASRRRRQPIAT